MPPPVPPPDTFPARRERLRAALAEKHPDAVALLVDSPVNVTYLTGFTGDSTRLLIGPDVERLISDSRYETQLAEQCPGLDATIRTQATSFADATARVLEKGLAKQRGPVLIEAEHLTVAEFEKLKGAAAGTPLLTAAGLVERLRAVKDDWEIARLREAVVAAEGAFSHVFQNGDIPVGGDDCERTLSYRLEAALRDRGAKGFSFGPILAVGDRGALPHYEVGDPVPRSAGSLLVDWGARMPGGYVSDLTRTCLVDGADAPPDDEFRSVYDTVNAAVDAALAVLRPGVELKEVDATARKVIADAGYEQFFGHGLGHGIGLEVHEAPRQSAISEDTAAAGMVVTVEPGVYLPGRFGVRIEEDVLITPGGCEVLSTLPRAEPIRVTLG